MNIQKLDFLLLLNKVWSILSRGLDASLGGLGWSEFSILYRLAQSPDKKLKRIDLADQVWLTASGVTRLLLPMEKIGLVSKEANPNDARVSLVAIAPGWERKLNEALDRLEYITDDLLKNRTDFEIAGLSQTLESLRLEKR